MEAFAGLPSVRATWSSEIARLEDGNKRAVITALVLDEGAQNAHQMKGVMIDLSNGEAKDRIYLDETATERTRAALVEISDAVARHGISGSGCMGAREFWPGYNWPWNKLHELNADYCGRGVGYALVLSARGQSAQFEFSKSPLDLSAILVAAMTQLKEH
jgi:hypothetical protein